LQPDKGKDEMQRCHKSPREFLEACSQPSKLFDAIEMSLNKIAVFVDVSAVSSRNNTVFSTRGDCLSVSNSDTYDKRIGAMPLVGYDRHCLKAIGQRLGLRSIRDIATSQKQTDGITQSTHCSITLCRQFSTRASRVSPWIDVVERFQVNRKPLIVKRP
jgi:hypothetical protein